MKPAPALACAAVADDRPSIAARSARPGGAPGRALRAVLGVAFGLALCAVATDRPALAQGGGGPGQIGVAEPLRPQRSVPYDSALGAWRAGRGEEALALAESALKTDPRNPQLRFLRGVILAERGRTDEAFEAFRSLTEDFPELPEPYNNLAVIHAQRGDWDAARQAIEQSIRAVPDYGLAHENLGDIHLQLATRSYERAGRLDPRNDSARGKLALSRELLARVQSQPVDPRNPRLGATPQVTPR
jgi:tetratricopeptide (TPR) repeat protein